MLRKMIPALLVLALLLGRSDDALAIKTGERSGWLVGISLGFGRGQTEDARGNVLSARGGAAPQWRIGHTLGPRWALTLEWAEWFIEDGRVDTKARRSLQNWAPSLTWYPGNPDNAWGGLYLKAGIGVALAGTAIVPLAEDPETGKIEQVGGKRVDESGVGVLLGTGYDFWLTNHITVGAWATGSYMSIQEKFVDTGWFLTSALTLGWYF